MAAPFLLGGIKLDAIKCCWSFLRDSGKKIKNMKFGGPVSHFC